MPQPYNWRTLLFQASFDDLGNAELEQRQDYNSITQPIYKLQEIYDEDDDPNKLSPLSKAAKLEGLIGILSPWWEHHVNFQPWCSIVPDILYGIHELFFDHPFKWIQELVRNKEYD